MPGYLSSYMDEVSKFIDIGTTHAYSNNATRYIHCPCHDCKSEKVYVDGSIIRDHLVMHAFTKGYTIWTYHGEQTSGC